MGGQQGKERQQIIGPNIGTITRSTRAKYRSGRDIRPIGSNVFTEHSEALLAVRPLPDLPDVVSGGVNQFGETLGGPGPPDIQQQLHPIGNTFSGVQTPFSSLSAQSSNEQSSTAVKWHSRENLLAPEDEGDPQLFVALYEFRAQGENQLSLKKVRGGDHEYLGGGGGGPIGGGLGGQGSEDVADFNGIQRDLADLASSNDAESESEVRERTPDGEDSDHRNIATVNPLQISSSAAGSHSTFKVDSGHYFQSFRKKSNSSSGRDTRFSGRRGKMEKSESQGSNSFQSHQVLVGTLEVHNVKRAINRYGTLPKGARIGAYLESLRQSGLSQGIPSCVDALDPPRDNLNKDFCRLPPPPQELLSNDVLDSSNIAAMIRSNSTTSGFQPQSPLLARLSPRLQCPKSEKRNNNNKEQPTLADLEFPPPPTDLPPPVEDFGDVDQSNLFDLPPPPCGDKNYQHQLSPSEGIPRLGSRVTRSPRTKKREVKAEKPQSPVKVMQSTVEVGQGITQTQEISSSCRRSPGPQRANFNVSRKKLRDTDSLSKPPLKAKPNLDSSGGEGDSNETSPANRFGVSLRHRDQSSDSCDSLKSLENVPSQRVGFCPIAPRRHSQVTSLSRSPETSSIETDGPRTPSSFAEGGQMSPSPTSLEANRPSFEEESHSSKEDSLDDIPPTNDQEPTQGSSQRGSLLGLTANMTGKESNESPVSVPSDFQQESQLNKKSPTTTAAPQTKLVSELFESFKRPKGPKGANVIDKPPVTTKPVTITKDQEKISAGLKLLKKSDNIEKSEQVVGEAGVTFIPKLRKTERNIKCAENNATDNDAVNSLVDFRSQLRKTNLSIEMANKDSIDCKDILEDNIVKSNSKSEKLVPKYLSSPVEKTENLEKKSQEDILKEENIINDSVKLISEEDDSKRFSSSSISSLKRLWENKEEEKLGTKQDQSPLTTQTSPKYGSNTLLRKLTTPKGIKGDADTLKDGQLSAEKSPEEEKSSNERGTKSEKRAWPPTPSPSEVEENSIKVQETKPLDGKPSVPTKPLVKNFRPPPPAMGVKLPPPRPGGIYAIPSFVRPSPPFTLIKKEVGKDPTKDELSKPVKNSANISSNSPDSTGQKFQQPSEKSQILDGGIEIEEALSSIKKGGGVTSLNYIQLASKVASFQKLCDDYVDNIPPQSRFRMRELLGQLEKQARELKSSGNKPPSFPDKLFLQVEVTVQEISSTVRR
ncbi:Tyrosine-protein kinase Abl [Armadillidium vulgare]|nr:Tyrosine-protein kinase Abl [Armadillidium vulgare]